MNSGPFTYLFFYGSLKKAFSIQDQLGIRGALSFVEEASIAGQLYDLGPYPALVKGTGTVYGELFALRDEKVLTILDEYEGFDPDSPKTSFYIRELASCGERSVWIYVFQGDLRFAERLEEGIWPKPST